MMPESQGSTAQRDVGFAATRWSLVAGATERAQSSLAELCVRYWFPVYAYVRRSGHPPEGAQQVALAFFHHLVTQRLTQRDPATPGRFREFMLAELDQFLARHWDGTPVARPAEGLASPAPMEVLEARHQAEMVGTGSAAAAYQRGFAADVLAHALERLRREAVQAGRLPLFEALEPWLAAEPPPGEYEAMAQRLQSRPLSLVMALKRLRQRFRELADDELVETVANGSDLEAERAALRAALGA
jgi:hypothetical protein